MYLDLDFRIVRNEKEGQKGKRPKDKIETVVNRKGMSVWWYMKNGGTTKSSEFRQVLTG